MDSYGASLSNRRYPSGGTGLLGSSPSTSKLRLNQGSTLSNLSNNKKPRASSASVTRRNNSRYDASSTLPLGGSGSFLTQQQAQLLRASGSSINPRDNEGSAKNGNFISNNPALTSNAGGAFIGDSRGDSYDQIRRNYEQNRLVNAHKSGYNGSDFAASGAQNNTALVLGNSNGYNNNANNNNAYNNTVPRAQSASGMSRAANAYNNAFANGSNSNTQSNAYLAMRQNTSQYNNASGASPPPELMNGNANNNNSNTSFGNGAFAPNSGPAANTSAKNNNLPAGLSKFNIPTTTNTRGIANSSLSNNNLTGGAYLNASYGSTTVGSLMALTSNPASPRTKSSTEIIPANFVPTPILCAKSSYSATNKGVNRVSSHNKRVSFSTPLTNSTPLQNPFMCQNIPAYNAVNNGGAITTAGNAGNSGRYNTNSGNIGGNGTNAGGNNGLFRPASASAAMMSTATTHFLNNTLNTNATNSNNKHTAAVTNTTTTNNVIINGGVVLTGATVVASVSNSRSESPVNAPLTVSTPPINFGSAFNNLNAGSTPSSAQSNAPNMSKPPLFFSSIGGQQYENNTQKGTVEGVASPKYANHSAARALGSPMNATQTTTQPNNNTLQSSSGDSINNNVQNEGVLPSIRTQTPSPRPGSANQSTSFNNAPTAASSTNTITTNNNNSSNNNNNNSSHNTNPQGLVPLFTPSPNSSVKKGLVLSNSMENFASYGMTPDGIGTTQGSLSKYHTHMSANNLQSGSNSDNNSVNSSSSINSGNIKPSSTVNTSTSVPVAAGMKRISSPYNTNATANNTVNSSTATTANTNTSTTTTNPNNTSNASLHLRRNGSAGSLAELNFLRISPPVVDNNNNKLSPKSAAIVNSIRDDSVLLHASSGVISANNNTTNNKGKKRHASITDQLAHIGANLSNNAVNSNATTAASTPLSATNTASDSTQGKAESTSFFTQSLNSAIAIGRSVVSNVQSLSPTLTSGKHYTNSNNNSLSMHGTLHSSSNSLQSLTGKGNETYAINTPTANAYPIPSPVNSPDWEDTDVEESITGVGNSLVVVPCKSFSIGTYVCRSPTKMSFYAEHCEYPFNHPYENSTVYLSIPYRDMSAITTVGMKFRFKIPRKCSMVLGEFDAQNALHLVTLELSHTNSMSVVRERVVPLVTAK